MMKAHVRPARWEDVPTLAATMRAADIAEVKATSGSTPSEALKVGIENGETYVGCRPDDTPFLIYGVVPVAPGVGAIWMLATDDLHLYARQFLRECRWRIDELCRGYILIFNFTDARNTVHHKWIKWAGFTIIKRHEEFGVEKRPFLEFAKITESNHV